MNRPDHSRAAALLDEAPPFFARLRDEPLVFEEAVAHLGDVLPLLHELSKTIQDSIWHAEGDVATHTRMVCEEVEEALASGKAACHTSPYWRAVTRLAALLHDIAKPLTTREDVTAERTRIIAPHHAHRGASYIAYRLLDAGCPHTFLLDTLELVRLHHDPKRLVLRDAPPCAYLALARQTPLAALYDLEMADMRGRRCEDQQEQIDLIELFKLSAQSANAWHVEEVELWHEAFCTHIREGLEAHGLEEARIERAIHAGLAAHARQEIFTPHEAIARELASGERFCQVVLAMGPSGSGKSSKLLSYQTDGRRATALISLDALREEMARGASDQSKNREVVGRAREQLREALRAQKDVLFDATSLLRDHRAPILSLAMDYNAHTTIALAHTSPTACHRRNAQRERKVPSHILEKQLNALAWPLPHEAHVMHVFDEEGERLRYHRFDAR